MEIEGIDRVGGQSRLDPWYVTGFVEGEGCFTYSRGGRSLALYFAIKLTGKDRPLLEDIQEFFGGIGYIYAVIARDAPTRSSGYTKPASYYRITRLRDLERIVAHFDRYPLRGTKSGSFGIWREMVSRKLSAQRSKANSASLEDLARQLSAVSPRNERLPRT